MWNGMFSPNMTKKLTSDDVEFEPTNTDNLDLDPDWIEGILYVKLNGSWYSWEVTYQDYLDFESADFSRSWLNENLPINYVGGWGWPWGRAGGKPNAYFSI